MNDEIEHEHLKPTRHLATQAGCCHWTPIVPGSADAPAGAREDTVTPNPVESAAPSGEKKPD